MGIDLFYLFVENVFGGWIWAMMGFVAIFTILGMFARFSWTGLMLFSLFFVVANLLIFFGLSAVWIFALLAGFYLATSIARLISSMM
jgi:hypothetical protein